VPQAHAHRIVEVAERVVHAVRSQPCPLADGALQPVTCSVGFSAFAWQPRPDGATPWERALAAADAALYAAQEDGRDRAHCLLPHEPAKPEDAKISSAA
jgi:GGDEF domain-containing protein